MRILLIAPPWIPVPPPAYGGTETVLDALARGLGAVGHEVVLFTTADSECPVPKAWSAPKAIGIDHIAPAAEISHMLHAYASADDFDIIHDHTLTGPLHARALRCPPVVTTNHGPFDGELGDLYRAVSDDIGVIAISHHQASRARGVKIAAVIHHGVDVGAFPLGVGDGGYALTLGRMCPDKGIHVAVRIARAIGMPLLIAAKLREPLERDYFRDEIKPLLGGGIEYVGEVGGEEKVKLLAGARCLFNPIAWGEPFGMVMIESLACGTPVVTTNAGSAPELIDDGVTGFIRTSERTLGDALLKVDDLDREACRSAAWRRFSSERMVRDHLDLFTSIITHR